MFIEPPAGLDIRASSPEEIAVSFSLQLLKLEKPTQPTR